MTDTEKLQRAISLIEGIVLLTAKLTDSPISLQNHLNEFADKWVGDEYGINPMATPANSRYAKEIESGYAACLKGFKREDNPWERNATALFPRYYFHAWDKGWMKAHEEKGA